MGNEVTGLSPAACPLGFSPDDFHEICKVGRLTVERNKKEIALALEAILCGVTEPPLYYACHDSYCGM